MMAWRQKRAPDGDACVCARCRSSSLQSARPPLNAATGSLAETSSSAASIAAASLNRAAGFLAIARAITA